MTGDPSIAMGPQSKVTPTAASEPVELSVVIPCLNEAWTVGRCVARALAALEAEGVRGEVIVADNGSGDGSPAVAVAAGARVISAPERGYGAAVKAGVGAARGSFVLMGDADESYDFGELRPFLDRLRAGDDLVIGCRLPWGGGRIEAGAMPFLHRWLGTPVLTILSRLFFRVRVTDINCGMRAFRRDVFGGLGLRSAGMEFASEMAVRASVLGLKTSEVPITLHRDGREGRSHLRTWRDGWRHLRLMLLYTPRWLFVYPGFALLLMGVAFGGVLAAGEVSIGSVRFDVNTLLVSAMFVLVGFQLITFGLFARTYAATHGFLPESIASDRLLRLFRLEYALVAGAVLGLAGIGLLGWATEVWRETGFGPLAGSIAGRLVILSVTAIMLGIQFVSSGFFLSVLRMRRDED